MGLRDSHVLSGHVSGLLSLIMLLASNLALLLLASWAGTLLWRPFVCLSLMLLLAIQLLTLVNSYSIIRVLHYFRSRASLRLRAQTNLGQGSVHSQPIRQSPPKSGQPFIHFPSCHCFRERSSYIFCSSRMLTYIPEASSLTVCTWVAS